MQLLFHLITAYWWALPPLAVAAYLKTPTGKGQLGEALVNVVARFGLKRNEYRLLKNVTLPTADGSLAPTLKTNREHKQHVQALVAQKPTRTKAVPTAVAPAAPRPDRRCPKCSSALARRTIPTGARAGTGFTCCSRFPDCPFILDIRPPAAPTAVPAPSCNAAALPPTG
jgi:hypothetical protein